MTTSKRFGYCIRARCAVCGWQALVKEGYHDNPWYPLTISYTHLCGKDARNVITDTKGSL